MNMNMGQSTSGGSMTMSGGSVTTGLTIAAAILLALLLVSVPVSLTLWAAHLRTRRPGGAVHAACALMGVGMSAMLLPNDWAARSTRLWEVTFAVFLVWFLGAVFRSWRTHNIVAALHAGHCSVACGAMVYMYAALGSFRAGVAAPFAVYFVTTGVLFGVLSAVYLAGYVVRRGPLAVEAVGAVYGHSAVTTARVPRSGLPTFSLGLSMSRLTALLMSVGMVYMLRTMG